MTLTQARQSLLTLQRRLSAYEHALSLLYYDGVTTAPKGTADNRAQSTEILSGEVYRLSTGEETVSLLRFLEEHGEALDEKERRMVYWLGKDVRRMQKIPMAEYLEIQRQTVEAEDVWHTAKERSDFALFCPHLENMFHAAKKIARYCAPEKDPYDYWLGEYEEGLDRRQCDAFFATLRERLVPLIHRIGRQPQLDDSMLHTPISAARQDVLSRRLMEIIGLDLSRVGLSTTEHPFTTSLGSHLDERITTHYHEDDFSSSLFSVIHEGGHALYDTGSDDSLAYTVLDGGVSMSIHESQSRFYENLLGRSRGFCEYLFGVLSELFPSEMAGYDAAALYRALNRAQPSLIRTQADELTYSLHVMVRYEIEKQVMSDQLSVSDIPEAWNRLYKEYLGVDVPDDRHGCLQDSHWSGGMIGYFPSYALGSAYGAQFLHKMQESVDVDGCLRRGDFAPINNWNREHIWRHGRLYLPGDLFQMAAGAAFDPSYYTDYLIEKYSALYGL